MGQDYAKITTDMKLCIWSWLIAPHLHFTNIDIYTEACLRTRQSKELLNKTEHYHGKQKVRVYETWHIDFAARFGGGLMMNYVLVPSRKEKTLSGNK